MTIRCFWGLTMLLMLCISAGAQVVPAAVKRAQGGFLVEGSAGAPGENPDSASYDNLFGITLGAYLQARPWLGGAVRAAALESTGQPGREERQQAVLAGPRFALSHKRLSVDAAVLGGYSHSDYPSSPPIMSSDGGETLVSAAKPVVETGVGMDVRFTSHISWRTGEVMYQYTPGPAGPRGVTFSSGLVFVIAP